MSIKVAPSILSADFANMGKAVSDVEKWGSDYVHFDVMDGVYVTNITFGMPMCKAVRPYTKLPLDVHLMITEPEKYVKRFCEAGADIVTFHPEASKDVNATLDIIKKENKKCGLALNPDKDINLITPYLDKLDMVIIMGVFPGYGGQKFIPEVLDKVRALKNLKADLLIELDGGVTVENAKTITDAGVDILVGGSSVFGSSDPAETIELLKSNK